MYELMRSFFEFRILFLGHHYSILNCYPSPSASILKGRIKIDYLIKSHVHWKFFIETFKNYSKSYCTLYKYPYIGFALVLTK